MADAAGAYPGYQATEVYPPTGDGDEWVIIVHFDDEAMLRAWLDAPERTAWLAKLPRDALGFRQQTMPAGFGSWVAGQTADGTPVPHWKSFLLVLVGLYPVVMLLTLVASPRMAGLGMALPCCSATSSAWPSWNGPSCPSSTARSPPGSRRTGRTAGSCPRRRGPHRRGPAQDGAAVQDREQLSEAAPFSAPTRGRGRRLARSGRPRRDRGRPHGRRDRGRLPGNRLCGVIHVSRQLPVQSPDDLNRSFVAVALVVGLTCI
jgi:hypothetical protein